jgi:spermidine synthase
VAHRSVRPSRLPGPLSTRPLTREPAWPAGPVAISTGTVEVQRDRDDPRSVTVLVNGVPSSSLHLDEPARLDFEYMQQMAVFVAHAAPAATALSVVHLGAAGCAFARHVHATRPGSRQTAIELDPTLAELVRAWFSLPRSPALRIRAGDAREVLRLLPDASADVVVRDVFAGDHTPSHVTTRQFLHDVARVLRPGGLYLANCADRPPLAQARSEVATALAVMADVALVAEPGQLRGRRYGNLVIAGITRGSSPDVETLLGRADVARELRSLPVPAHVVHGTELEAFAATAPVLEDPPPPADPVRP